MQKSENTFDCAVIGSWHLAFVTAAGLSALGKKVILVRPGELSSMPASPPLADVPLSPVNEPGLNELISKSAQAGLFAVSQEICGDWQAPVVWLAIDTPVNEEDVPDLSPLYETAELVASKSKTWVPQEPLKAFIVSSQIPLGFSQDLINKYNLPVVYIPENLRLGKGLETFLKADRVVVGAQTEATRKWVCDFLTGLEGEFVSCDLPTSEMIKHATNIFLATSISYANELAKIGETQGADAEVVARALKLDSRIGGKAYVRPGLGFAGGTLPRDLRVIQSLGRKAHTSTPLVDAVLQVNAEVYSAVGESVLRLLGAARRLLILGYTYKAETNTLRRSPALELARFLKTKKVEIFGFDPMMQNENLDELDGLIQPLQALTASTPRPDVIITLTARPDFKNLPWKMLQEAWQPNHKSPITVFDTQGIISDPQLCNGQMGFNFKAIWQPVKAARPVISSPDEPFLNQTKGI